MKFRSRRATIPAAFALLTLCGCDLLQQQSAKSAPKEHGPQVKVEMAHGVPIGRDETGQAILRVDVFESRKELIAVPYLYGYPLFSGKGASAGIRKLRHENWEGYERVEHESKDGLLHVTEKFPALRCRFEGVQESPEKYVPLSLVCAVPPTPELGGAKRAVVGGLRAGATPSEVRNEPSLVHAFLGEWHATSPGFNGKEGTGYFATPDGLLGFEFEKGRLSRVAFLFDAPTKEWRRPELWAAP